MRNKNRLKLSRARRQESAAARQAHYDSLPLSEKIVMQIKSGHSGKQLVKLQTRVAKAALVVAQKTSTKAA